MCICVWPFVRVPNLSWKMFTGSYLKGEKKSVHDQLTRQIMVIILHARNLVC